MKIYTDRTDNCILKGINYLCGTNFGRVQQSIEGEKASETTPSDKFQEFCRDFFDSLRGTEIDRLRDGTSEYEILAATEGDMTKQYQILNSAKIDRTWLQAFLGKGSDYDQIKFLHLYMRALNAEALLPRTNGV